MSGGDRKIATFARTGSRSVEGVVRRAARHSSRDDPAGTELLEHLEDQVPAVASDSVVVAVVAHVRGLSGEPLDDLLALLAGEQCADRVALDRAAQQKSMGAAGRRLAVGGEALVFRPAACSARGPRRPAPSASCASSSASCSSSCAAAAAYRASCWWGRGSDRARALSGRSAGHRPRRCRRSGSSSPSFAATSTGVPSARVRYRAWRSALIA